MLILRAPTALTHVAKIYDDSFSQVGNDISLPEVLTGIYAATPTGLAAGTYLVLFFRGTDLVDSVDYQWDGAKEVVSTDAASRAESKADLTAISAAIAAAKTAAESVDTKLTSERAIKLDTVATTATANTYKATVPTTAAIASAVWASTTRALTDKADFSLSTAGISAISSAVWASTTRTLSSFGTLIADIWQNGTRGLTEAVATDAASRTASQADLSPLAASIAAIPTNPLLATDYTAPYNTGIANIETVLSTPDLLKADLTDVATASELARLTALLTVDDASFSGIALTNAPTGSGSGSGLTPEQATWLANLNATLEGEGVFSAAALANGGNGNSTFDPATDFVKVSSIGTVDVSGFSTLDSFKANVSDLSAVRVAVENIPTNNSINAITTVINAARDSVLLEGSENWAGGGSGGGLLSDERAHLLGIPTEPLLAEDYEPTAVALSSIDQVARMVLQAQINDLQSFPENSTIVVYGDDGTTPVLRFQFLDASGEPTLTNAVQRKKVVLS